MNDRNRMIGEAHATLDACERKYADAVEELDAVLRRELEEPSGEYLEAARRAGLRLAAVRLAAMKVERARA